MINAAEPLSAGPSNLAGLKAPPRHGHLRHVIPYSDTKGYDFDMSTSGRRVLLHLADGRRVPVEADEVFLLDAVDDETEVRTRGRRRLRDVRSLGEVVERFPPGLFVVIHRSYAVNVDRIAEIRPRGSGRDWEVKLEPPVNRVLPVARGRLEELWASFGE